MTDNSKTPDPIDPEVKYAYPVYDTPESEVHREIMAEIFGDPPKLTPIPDEIYALLNDDPPKLRRESVSFLADGMTEMHAAHARAIRQLQFGGDFDEPLDTPITQLRNSYIIPKCYEDAERLYKIDPGEELDARSMYIDLPDIDVNTRYNDVRNRTDDELSERFHPHFSVVQPLGCFDREMFEIEVEAEPEEE